MKFVSILFTITYTIGVVLFAAVVFKLVWLDKRKEQTDAQ